MLKNIQVKINADNSITANYPYKIYQGEINKNRFVVDPSLIINDLTNVVGYIGFKRSDNQKSGFVPMEKQADGTFLYVIKDYWTLNIPNKVWFTIKFVRTDSSNENVELQIYSGNSSFNVNPLADYIIGDDIPPDTSTILQNEIDTKLNKDFTTYEKLAWEEVDNDDLVVLNKVEDGVVTPYYAEAKDLYTTVNDIHADEEGNIEITGSDITVSETNTRSIEDELHLKVEYNTNQVITQPTVTVYSAEYAEKDANGNTITQKYVAVDNNQNITGIKKLVRNVEYDTVKPTPNLKLQNNYLGNDGELSIYTDHNKDITMYSDRSDNIFSNNLDLRLQGYSTLVSNVASKITAIKYNDNDVSRVSLDNGNLIEHKLWDKSDFDIWVGTLAQYNLLENKDSKTFYLIIEEV